VRVSFLEIYNEELTDLLGADSVENPRLKIYEDNLRKVLTTVLEFCIIETAFSGTFITDRTGIQPIATAGEARTHGL